MQTRTTNFSVDAESVWGIERMDPVEQFDWAQDLWQRLQTLDSRSRPLFLLYSPAAERAALRGLTALAGLGREEGFAVHTLSPVLLPVLPPISANTPTLCLVHRGSRWVNVEEWLNRIAALPDCRIVITAPTAPDEGRAIIKKFNGFTIPVPEEEPDYCEAKARDILNKLRSVSPEPALAEIERILIEAGVAELAVPLTLLARQAGLEIAALAEKLRTSRLREFIWWPEQEAETPRLVAFRGRWLAEIMAPETRVRHYPRLTALLGISNPAMKLERYFFLNLLAALRTPGDGGRAEQLLRDYYDHFHTAGQSAGPEERQAWAYFHPLHLQPFFRI